MTIQGQIGGRRLVCDRLGFLPSKLCVIPWGKVESTAGNFEVDHESAVLVLEAFKRRGVELVIDFEHQTLGGRYASPDGKAPAAGWIKRLEMMPGHGILGNVQWSDTAGKMIGNREYRYLSPVVIIDEASRKAIELHSVALTNKPAIAGAVPIVNKDGGETTETTNMDEIVIGLEKLVAAGTEGGLGVDALLEGLRDLLQTAKALKGGKEEILATAQANADEGLKGKARVLASANQALRCELDQREFDTLIAAHSDAIPPAIRGDLKRWWVHDRDGATRFVKMAPKLVNIGIGEAGRTGGGDQNRAALIHRAKTEFAAESGKGVVICSGRAWVNTALRDAGFDRLSEDEARQYSIVG